MVGDTNLLKDRIKFFIFTTPFSLDGKIFFVKESFNKCLKFSNFLKNLRFKLKKINPCKFAKVINKVHIVFVPTR
jgi:hypothetical protein